MRFVINPFTDKLDAAQISGSGAPQIETLTGNDGTPVGPDGSFNLNLLGENSTGINVTGNAGTHTLTIHGIASTTSQVGTTAYATNAQAAAQSSSTVALTPSNITSFYSTNPLPASQGGTGLSSPAAHSLIVTEGSSAFTVLGVASNGQLPIGSVGSDPVLATITAGAGISITNGPGSITVTATGSGFAWSDQTGSFSAVKENGYFITGTSTATLPAGAAEGDSISFIVDTTNVLTITANTGQVIRIGSAVSASAGTAASNARGDSVTLTFRATGSSWISQSTQGTWTVT